MKDQVGPYRILGEMGQGGMAVVYRAIQESVRRVVALKVLPEALSGDESAIRRFRQEAEVAANLKHPNIVNVWDAHLHEPPYYFAMEFMGAGSLHDRIRQKNLSLENIRRVFTEICSAMDHAHERRIIHRDVKPANILFDPDGRPVLIDFGILRIQDTARMTVAGMKIGTPHYMSPEQAKGLDLDARSDLYSCAVIMYEMLAGRTPFTDDGDPTSVLYKVVHEPPPPLDSERFELPDIVDHVMARALAKSPGDRFADGASMAAAFGEALAGASEKKLAAPPPPPPPPASKPHDSASVPPAPSQGPPPSPRPDPVAGPNPVPGPQPSTGPPADAKAPEAPSPPSTFSGIRGRTQRVAAVAVLAGILIAAAALIHSLGLIALPDTSFADAEPAITADAGLAAEPIVPADEAQAVEIPDFAGRSVEDVRAWCEQQTPPVECDAQLQDSPIKDIVLSQHPPAGTIWSSEPVTVKIGRGVTVPNLIGMPQSEAQATLKRSGLVWTSSGDDGTNAHLLVGEQSPAADESLSKGGTVRLTLQAATTVPKITGKTPDVAREEAKAAGLTWHVKATEDVKDPATERLAVISQSPSAGSTVISGAILYVREGVEVKVPAVVALGAAGARKALEGAGFAVEVAYQNTSGAGGVLKGQTPKAGTFVPRGSTVTLTVTRHIAPIRTSVSRHNTGSRRNSGGGNSSGSRRTRGGGGSDGGSGGGDVGPTPF